VLHLLRSMTGLDNVVFGSDHTYPNDDMSIGGLRSMERTAELSDVERHARVGTTAERLIPRLADVSSPVA
jgi:hypothetical protein